MKAIRFHEFGGPEVLKLENVAEPEPGIGQVLVRARAAGINPVDTYIRSGTYAFKPELPHTPGFDGAGIVEGTGERVYFGGTSTGSSAELAVCDSENLYLLPDNVSFAEGAAIAVPYGTAHRALFARAHAQPGETVLVHGASGGVGTAAVQLARAAGMTVIGTAGTAEGRELVAREGAHHILDHGVSGYLDALMEHTDGKGVDVILEMLANVNLGKDLQVLSRGGRVVVIGSRGHGRDQPARRHGEGSLHCRDGAPKREPRRAPSNPSKYLCGARERLAATDRRYEAESGRRRRGTSKSDGAGCARKYRAEHRLTHDLTTRLSQICLRGERASCVGRASCSGRSGRALLGDEPDGSVKRANFLSGLAIDRVSRLRADPNRVAEAWARPDTRVLPVWRSKHLVLGDEPANVVFIDADKLAEDSEAVLLGEGDRLFYFAVDLSYVEEPGEQLGLDASHAWLGLREIAPLVPQSEGALLAYANGIMSWHRRHLFCGQCGSATSVAQAGHVRECAACGTMHFPRTDPAVIMLVTEGEHCLVGRQPSWPKKVYSTIAGFVEPGESLEEAVTREVHEETGVLVGDVRYHSSQPWPFPGSLMLGFTAVAETRDITLPDDELEDARWFTREELKSGERVQLPSEISIARRLIEDWLER